MNPLWTEARTALAQPAALALMGSSADTSGKNGAFASRLWEPLVPSPARTQTCLFAINTMALPVYCNSSSLRLWWAAHWWCPEMTVTGITVSKQPKTPPSLTCLFPPHLGLGATDALGQIFCKWTEELWFEKWMWWWHDGTRFQCNMMKQLLGCSNWGRESQELEKVPGAGLRDARGAVAPAETEFCSFPRPLPSTHNSGVRVCDRDSEPRCSGTVKYSSCLYCFLQCKRPESKPRI